MEIIESIHSRLSMPRTEVYCYLWRHCNGSLIYFSSSNEVMECQMLHFTSLNWRECEASVNQVSVLGQTSYRTRWKFSNGIFPIQRFVCVPVIYSLSEWLFCCEMTNKSFRMRFASTSRHLTHTAQVTHVRTPQLTLKHTTWRSHFTKNDSRVTCLTVCVMWSLSRKFICVSPSKTAQTNSRAHVKQPRVIC